MFSDFCLYLAGIFVSFFLQITAGYLACSLLNRTLNKPRQRFGVWVVFVICSAFYWIGLVAWQLRSFFHSSSVSGSVVAGGSVTPSLFLLPLSWSGAVLSAGKIVAASYVAVVALLLAVSAWRQLRLWILLRKGWAAPENITSLFKQMCRDLGITGCDLLILPGLPSPATVGWLRPRVLLPAICEELGPTSRLAHVLHHELTHVARRDYLWASLSDLACRLLFFHPAVWRAKTLSRFQGELACDLAVVEAQPERRADYADSLAYFVRLRMLAEQEAFGIDFASAPSGLGTRIRLILAGSPALPWWKRIPRKAAALAIVCGFAATAPALNISFGFFRPLAEVAVASPNSSSVGMATERHARVSSDSPHTRLPEVTDLSKLRVGRSSSDSANYALNKRDYGNRGDRSGDLDRPWREAGVSVGRPSVADVVGSAVAIAVSHPDHDRDRTSTDKHAAQR